MSVAADYNRESRRFSLEVQLRQVVQDVNRNAAQLEYMSLRHLSGPCSLVDVPTHRCDRGNRGKLFEDFGIAHIPCVNNMFRSAQGIDRLGTQQTMGVRDNADQFSFLDVPLDLQPGFRLHSVPGLKSVLRSEALAFDAFIASASCQVFEVLGSAARPRNGHLFDTVALF